jgi:membrane-bound lytic murein transglycosylase B
MKKNMKIRKILFAFLLLISLPTMAEDAPKQDFLSWMRELRLEAIDAGISKKTVNATLKSAKFMPSIIKLDRGQPEFISPFLTYVDKHVNANQVQRGRELLLQNEPLLKKIEAQYGVPKTILVAFWGMETNYGNNQGNIGLPSSLITLAYDGRRADFFRGQLFDAMRIVDAGHNTVGGLRGSWAGAMGQMQFMPSTFIAHGVDGDGDGRIDIWRSLPDALSSAANYVSKVGWVHDEPAAIEVKLPAKFDYNLAQMQNRKSTTDWGKLGVRTIEARPLPFLDNAAIILPQGYQGPAFMVFSNFDVIMDWNRSVNYALSVVQLANQFVGDTPIIGGADAENEALSFNQIMALQTKLNQLGFDCGTPDGFPGLKTQTAIRQYQATQKLPQDGFASPSLYALLLP